MHGKKTKSRAVLRIVRPKAKANKIFHPKTIRGKMSLRATIGG